MLTFNTDGMVAQPFPFKTTLMNYIFKNLKPADLIKLYQCSKFFYAKFRLNIIRHLEIVVDEEAEKLDPTKTVIRYSNPALPKLVDFWITDSFVYRGPYAFIPPFTHCTVKKLELEGNIFWKDYKLLTKSGTIQDLKIKNVVDLEIGEYVPVDKIIAEVPNATSIEIIETKISPTTFESLLMSDHAAEITNLVLKAITPHAPFNIDLFVDFVSKNSADDCNVNIDFKLAPVFNENIRLNNNRLVNNGKMFCKRIAEELKIKQSKKQHAASLKE